jgi:hypothetical protein
VYTYSHHTNVSAQYVTLCFLERILLYLYAAILTMIPEQVFPLLQRKYENLKRAMTTDWYAEVAQAAETNTMHNAGLTKVPHKTDHRTLTSVFAFYHSIASTLNTVHAGSEIPVEYKHTSSISWKTFSQSEKRRTGPLTVNYHYTKHTATLATHRGPVPNRTEWGTETVRGQRGGV